MIQDVMMIFLKLFGKLLRILRDGPSPGQIAGGIVLGMCLGMMPSINFYSVLVLLVILLLNVNISAAIFGWMVFKLFAFLLDPVFHSIGYALLRDAVMLNGFWTFLFNLPITPLTRFNNTVVLGSFVISLTLVIPLFFFSKMGVLQYRNVL